MQSACAILYFHLLPVRLYNIFSYYFIDVTIFLKKKIIEHAVSVLIFCTSFFKIFFILRRIKRDIIINVQTFLCSTCYSCQILIKLEFSRRIFNKSLNTKFHENPSTGTRVVSCGQTDGRTDRQTDMPDEANSRFSQLCEHA